MHQHQVYDTDNHFVIGPITKEIINQSEKMKLMLGDHNSERFTFEIPRYIDGHDMTLCNKIEIHYINIDSKTKESNKGVYIVDDMQLSPNGEDVVVFSWLISANATQLAGTLNFRITFKCISEPAIIDYQMSTEIFKGITVSDGISNSESVIEEYSDVLEQWKQELNLAGEYAQQIQQNASEIDKLQVGLSESRDYVNEIINYEIKWNDGGYISKDDGSVKSETGSSYSDFVAVMPGTKLIITNTMTDNNECNAFYDANKTFLSSFSNATGEVIVPDGAVKMRLSKYSTATITIASNIKSYIDDSIENVEANAKLTDDAIAELKGDLDTLAENDFIAILNSKLDVIKGKFEKGSIDVNGQNVFSNDLIRSIDYIKIYPGIPYQFKTINGNGLAIRIYKSDGSIRSEYMGATTTERTRTITFNSDDEKIRVVINAYKDDYTTYPVSADNFESIIANVSEYIAKDYNYGSIYNGTINIDTVNKIVSTSGVSILTNYGVYITVPAGEINIDYEVAVYIGVNKYDSEHNLIVRTLDSSMASDFIRIFVYHKGKVWFADKINGIAINGKNYNENVKTICCIGDSFTASNISWHTFIGQNLGYDMVNLGVSGTRMTVTYTSGGTNYECFIDRVANGALNSYSPDLIVLFGGINDTVKLHNNQMHIGTIDDEAEYSASTTSGYSFIGRVKYLINLIKEKKPSAQILGVIPPNYSEGTSGYEWWSEYIAQIQEALRKVYEYYGIPYVDLKKRCQEMYENAYNLSTYRINGRSNMHPSKNGYKAIAKCIQKDGIENMFVN